MPKQKKAWSNPVFFFIVLGVVLLLATGGILSIRSISQPANYTGASAYPTSDNTDLGMVLLEIEGEQAVNQYRVACEGVYVLSVLEGSPAQKAGVLPGDLITEVNNQTADSMEQMDAIFVSLDYRNAVLLTVVRNEETLCLTMNCVQESQ